MDPKSNGEKEETGLFVGGRGKKASSDAAMGKGEKREGNAYFYTT